MRKKNFGSKKATKAIALGLSAMIATSQPIMLMAEEAPAAPAAPAQQVAPATVNSAEQQKVEEAKDKLTDSKDALKEADNVITAETNNNKVDTVKEAVDAIENDKFDLKDQEKVQQTDENGNPKFDENGQPVYEVKETDKSLDGVIKGMADELKSDVDMSAGVAKKLDVLEDDLAEIERTGKTEEKEKSELNTASNDLDTGADRIVSDYEKTVKDASDDIADDNKKIINAKSIVDAQAAFKDATDKAKDAQDKYQTALDELSGLEKAYSEAKAEYDTAKKNYDDALAKARTTKTVDGKEIVDGDVAKALEALEEAQADAESLRLKAEEAGKRVDELKNKAEEEARNLANNGYQKILNAQEELAKSVDDLKNLEEGTDDYNKQQKVIDEKQNEIDELIVKSYIEKELKGTQVTFGTKEIPFIVGYEYEKDADGNPKLDEAGNKIYKIVDGKGVAITETKTYKTVTYTYTDENGEQKTETYLFDATVDENGNRQIDSLKTEEVNGQEVVLRAHEDAVAESWKTADNNKTFTTTDTTHTVAIDNADESQGFYAIDTEKSTFRGNYPIDDVSTVVTGNTTVSYQAVGNESTTNYMHDTFMKETGEYEKKTGPHNQKIDTDDVVSEFERLKAEGYEEVKLYYHHAGFFGIGAWDEEIDTGNPDWWTSLKGSVKDFFDIKAFWVDTKGEVDDKTKPIKESADGIMEVVTQDFTKTTTTTNSVKDAKGNTTADTKYDRNAYQTVTNAAEAAKAALLAQNTEGHYFTNVFYTVEGKKRTEGGVIGIGAKKYYTYSYRLSYTEVTVSSEVVKDVVISRKLYEADTYTVHDAGKAEVSEIKAYSTTLRDTKNNSLKESDLNSALETQKIAVEDNKQLQKDYAQAISNYSALAQAAKEAKEKVAKTKGEVETLEKQLAQLSRMGVNNETLLAKITTAKQKLADYKKDADDLDEEVKKAGQNLQDTIKRLTPPTEDNTTSDDGNDDSSSTDDGTVISTVASSNSNTGAGTQTQNVNGTNTTRNRVANNNVANQNAQDAADSVNIDNNQMPLDATAGNDVTEKNEDSSKKESVNIGDNLVALAANATDEQKNFAWWIIALIVAALATTTAAYENHKKKVAAKNNTLPKND